MDVGESGVLRNDFLLKIPVIQERHVEPLGMLYSFLGDSTRVFEDF